MTKSRKKFDAHSRPELPWRHLREVATVPELAKRHGIHRTRSMAGRSRFSTTWRAFSRAARALWGMARRSTSARRRSFIPRLASLTVERDSWPGGPGDEYSDAGRWSSACENLSVSPACALLNLARSASIARAGHRRDDLALMRRIDELHLKWPFYGSRRMVFELNQAGHGVNRKRVQRLMRVNGIEALVPRPGNQQSRARPQIYPYLLRGVSINRANHVWAATSPISMGSASVSGAIIDWASGRFWRGACRTRWIRAFASPRSTKRWRARRRKYQHDQARSHQRRLHRQARGCSIAISMDGRVVSWTIFSSNGCGARSNTRKCI